MYRKILKSKDQESLVINSDLEITHSKYLDIISAYELQFNVIPELSSTALLDLGACPSYA